MCLFPFHSGTCLRQKKMWEVFLELIDKGEGISTGSHLRQTIKCNLNRSPFTGRPHNRKRQPASVRILSLSNFILVNGVIQVQLGGARQESKYKYDSCSQARPPAWLCISISLKAEASAAPRGLAGTKTPTGPPRKAIWSSSSKQHRGEGGKPPASLILDIVSLFRKQKAAIYLEGSREFDFPGKTWPSFLMYCGGRIWPFPSLPLFFLTLVFKI